MHIWRWVDPHVTHLYTLIILLADTYSRSEIVTKPLVIEAYLKIRKNKNEDFM